MSSLMKRTNSNDLRETEKERENGREGKQGQGEDRNKSYYLICRFIVAEKI